MKTHLLTLVLALATAPAFSQTTAGPNDWVAHFSGDGHVAQAANCRAVGVAFYPDAKTGFLWDAPRGRMLVTIGPALDHLGRPAPIEITRWHKMAFTRPGFGCVSSPFSFGWQNYWATITARTN